MATPKMYERAGLPAAISGAGRRRMAQEMPATAPAMMAKAPNVVFAIVPDSSRWRTFHLTRSVRSAAAMPQTATTPRIRTTSGRVLTTNAVPRPKSDPMLMIM